MKKGEEDDRKDKVSRKADGVKTAREEQYSKGVLSIQNIKAEAQDMASWLVDTRRALHEIPEPGNQEFETA
ncbi:MAG: hypothetical protein ABFC74_01720, partial [Rectinema sp.]